MCNCKISGMKRKRIGKISANGIGDALTGTVLPVALGFLAAKVITKQLTFLSGNPMVGGIVKLGGGLLLASQGNGMLNKMGYGIATEGAVGFALPMLEKSGIALLPPGEPSRYLAGFPDVAGPVESVPGSPDVQFTY